MKFSVCCITRSRSGLGIRFRAGFSALLIAILFTPGLCRGQDDLRARIAAVATKNSLDGAGMKPWHLKVAYSKFNEAGKPAGDGTAEEWWLAPDSTRLELTEGGKTSVSLKTPDGVFSSPDPVMLTQPVQLILEQIVHPIAADDLADTELRAKDQKFGKLETQCIMLAQSIPKATDIPFGLFPTYCVEGDLLRVSWLATNINVFSIQSGVFQGHSVPVKIGVFTGKTKQAEAHIEELGTIAADSVDLKTAGLTKGPPGTVRVSGGVMAGQILTKVQPNYPEQARRGRSTGTVVMAALIGTDGRIHKLQVISSPDPDLSIAALAAVQQWTYRPYLLNGVPVALNTTITVNFNLNRI